MTVAEDAKAANARLRREWQQRPRLTTITPAALGSVSDEWIEQVTLDFIWAHGVLPGTETKRLLETLPPGFATIYCAWALDAEIGNGGFQQYFWNQGAEFLGMTEKALRDLGAEEHAAIFDEAVRVFARWNKPSLTGMGPQQQLEAFSEAATDDVFESVDRRWPSSDLEVRRKRYIRENAHLFTASISRWRRLRAWLRGVRLD